MASCLVRRSLGSEAGAAAQGRGSARAAGAAAGPSTPAVAGSTVPGVSPVPYLAARYRTHMPSSKKRITVYLTDEQHALIERAAVATGESRAAMVVSLIDAAAPMLSRVAELAEAIAAAPEQVRSTFAGAAEQLEDRYGGMLTEAEAFWADLDAAIKGAENGGEQDGPRLVTRGPES